MDFTFKYISEEELNKIVREVQRQRRKRMEEKQWESYIASKTPKSNLSFVKNESPTLSDQESIPEELCECYAKSCDCMRKSSDNIIDEAGDTNVDNNECRKKVVKFPGGDRENFVINLLPDEIKSRFDNIEDRLLVSLNKLSEQIDKQTPIVDEEDEVRERRAKRATEFIARFSRNYLYQLRRQVELLKKEKNFNIDEFFKKLVLAFQTAAQAVQTCQHFLPDTSRNACEKIIEFMEELLVLLNFVVEQIGNTPEKWEVPCEDMIRLVNHVISRIEESIKEQERADAFILNKIENSRPNPNRMKRVPNKLSMYCTKLPRDHWKKISTKLAKNKFGIAPRKKNVGGENALIIKSQKVAAKQQEIELDEATLKKLEKFQKGWRDEQEKLRFMKAVSEDASKIVKQEPIPEHKIETVIETIPIDTEDEAEKEDHLDVIGDIELPKDSEERLRHFLLFDKLTELLNEHNDLDEDAAAAEASNNANISKANLCKILNQIREMYRNSSLLGFDGKELDKRCKSDSSSKSKKDDSKCDKVKTPVENVKLTCVKFNENGVHGRNDPMIPYDDTSGNKPTTCLFTPHGKHWCVPFNINASEIERIDSYRCRYQEYVQRDAKYHDVDELLRIVNRTSDFILSRIINCVAEELDAYTITRKIYDLEFDEH